nr:immunoglobulin light chain junction region [Macaca mulatta]
CQQYKDLIALTF